jgi:hypothetical protein
MEPNGSRVDDLLDEALKNYGSVEPRTGLEQRVLARLRAEREDLVRRWRWWPVAAVAAASVLAVGVLLREEPVSRPTTTTSATAPSPAREEAALGGSTRKAARTGHRWKGHTGNSPIVASAATAKNNMIPKREQFPSPTPLSRQEQMLADCVAEHRDRAVLVARAQTALLKLERLARGEEQDYEQPGSNPTDR